MLLLNHLWIEDVLLPPLHIKLGLMKNFVKGMNKEGQAFRYLRNKFPKVSNTKVKESIFVGPQIGESGVGCHAGWLSQSLLQEM